MSFTVGQLAKRSGLSVRSLHHYDEIGLLSPSERSEVGYRLYSKSDVERLCQIQALRWLDLPLGEVKEILERGGGAIPGVIDRQIAALTKQVEQASEMKNRLVSLRTRLLQGQIVSSEQLLGMVELFSHYEKHLSADDLSRVKSISDSDKDEWRRMYEDVAAAVQRKVAPDSDEAQEIAYRWGVLTYKISNGDMSVMLKTKAAYESDEGVRRSMLTATGADPAVLQFVIDASNHAHLKIISKYLDPGELARLNLKTVRSAEWLRIVTALREEFAKQASVDSLTVQGLITAWSAHLDACADGDNTIKAKLLAAIGIDYHLQKRWLLDADLLEFIRQAQTAIPAAR